MKVMIVDDEVIIRTGLAKVIRWDELGLELLPPAASAEEALDRIGAEKPHILLTDIRMTGKTGLQLAEEAKKILPDLEIIILTGYDDFSYVQQAIRQHVSDYLLKSSRPEEIIETVMKAKMRIEQKWAEQSEDRYREQQLRNRQFARWVVEGVTSETGESREPAFLSRLAGAGRLRVVLVEAKGWHGTASSEQLLLFAVENMLNDLLACETLIRKNQIILAVREEGTEKEERRRLLAAMAKVEKLLKCTLYAAIGSAADSPEQLPESFAAAELAFRYTALGLGEVWDYADIRDRKGGRTVCSYEEEKRLSAILLDNDPVALKSWVQQFTRELLQDPEMTVESYASALHSAALAAHRWLERVTAATGMEAIQEDNLPTPPPSLDRNDLFHHLYQLMQMYHSSIASGQSAHVKKAMAYIEERIGEDVSLQQVAKHVHLHPSHLSEIFKKETGMTFGDYVTRQRIARAMDILAVSPAKVSEVASLVGYEDVKYFGQLFKKHTGKTPSEYREEASSGKEAGMDS